MGIFVMIGSDVNATPNQTEWSSPSPRRPGGSPFDFKDVLDYSWIIILSYIVVLKSRQADAGMNGHAHGRHIGTCEFVEPVCHLVVITAEGKP